MKKLSDYKKMSKTEKNILEKCRTIIKSIDPTAKVILYGSRARGNAKTDSDYDLLILVEGEATFKKEDIFLEALFPLELETGAVFTVILTSSKEWNSPLYRAMPLYQNIRREGIAL